jgi:DNA polymerase III subunit gamma/tau
MSYQVFARKWRPKNFDEVIGQDHVTRALKNVLVRGSVAHAYVLTGTRGIGKTSIARLLAKALRCLDLQSDGNPCLQCSSCLEFDGGSSMDIVEVDGASNNSVDNVRDLISTLHYLPTTGKYKVYIIDEIHMLSGNAFNALLKTLEEPPAHVIFIMATTEPQKLLGTVLSRCVRFDLRHLSTSDLEKHIKNVTQQENIQFASPVLLTQVCKQGKGSVRDTLSLLEQLVSFSSNNIITEEEIVLSLGLARLSAVRSLVESMFSGHVGEMSGFYNQMLDENISSKNIALSLLDHLYQIIKYIDDEARLEELGVISQNTLDGIQMPELLWIFETISKDSVWALESIDPDKTLEIILQKISLRRDFFLTKSEDSSKKKLKIEHKVKVEPIEAKPIVPVEEKKIKTWEGFLSHVEITSPASLASLEQGNLLKPLDLNQSSLIVDLAFKNEDQLFYDHFHDQEVVSRIKKLLSDFFEFDLDKIVFNVQMIEDLNKDFTSVADEKNLIEKKEYEERLEVFLNQPILQEAKRVFRANVDKIVLSKK